MKNVFGSLIFIVAVSSVFANDPPSESLSMVSTGNDCGQPMGFIYARRAATPLTWSHYIIVGNHPTHSGYYAIGNISSNGVIGYGGYRIYWGESWGEWMWLAMSVSSVSLTDCQIAFQTYLQGLTSEERLDIEGVFESYFGDPPLESRLPMDTDLNGNGRLDYYDLDSPHYQDYLAMCAFFQIAPGDLRDYMYWYQNELTDWYNHRMNIVDSNGDGWSDGYKAIRGYGPYDEVNFIGRPDIGSSSLILGGVASSEPWRYEEYADGWSRGHVYDMGHDPFGNTPIETINAEFYGPPDWYAMDSSGDGVSNAQKIAMGQNPYTFNFQSGFVYQYNEQRGYWETVGGVTDGDFPNWTNPPTAEEWMAEYEERYGTGNYEYFPGDYAFGREDYDAILDKFEKIRVNIDSVRPETERDYKVHFYLPIPGASESYSISVIPDESMPAGAALNALRQIIRAMSAVVISYLFIRHVWLVIRQY